MFLLWANKAGSLCHVYHTARRHKTRVRALQWKEFGCIVCNNRIRWSRGCRRLHGGSSIKLKYAWSVTGKCQNVISNKYIDIWQNAFEHLKKHNVSREDHRRQGTTYQGSPENQTHNNQTTFLCSTWIQFLPMWTWSPRFPLPEKPAWNFASGKK